METTTISKQTATVLSTSELLQHWQGQRNLTRKVINSFPEKEFFEFSIGGMRTPAQLIQELLAIAVPGVRQIVTRGTEELNEHIEFNNSKATVLRLWDEASAEINKYWSQIPEDTFSDEILTFGQYPGTVCSSIFYFIENEIHHRGQLYVFLRVLGIEPPMFWDRS
ncbi:MAG: DinB family protein [Ferruginibacter sp.]